MHLLDDFAAYHRRRFFAATLPIIPVTEDVMESGDPHLHVAVLGKSKLHSLAKDLLSAAFTIGRGGKDSILSTLGEFPVIFIASSVFREHARSIQWQKEIAALPLPAG